ncbi:class I SAM-dependent methyltransferase [Chitinophaga sp. GCM10012297]|uniref:Class I SAM-dependent methyltransferase n=1 Tax=Chitinophaga chungangae TaxID=2821488 RepID=A0ABS3YCP0_9BACT|nr:class I SAM-dependent methyltransferase [Chitinophaga chungangae]MBO9152230.1 class I SAM-dependent methyltransferase [Chitinophaga chungangae]
MTRSKAPIAFLQEVIAAGGPETRQYETLHQVFEDITTAYRSGSLSGEELAVLQSGFCEEDGSMKTILGHSRSKPFGYAGDFLIIDKIYRQQVTADERFEKWDQFWHEQPACKAVRNRKSYFIRTIREMLKRKTPVRLLNVASGPARDLAEAYACIEPSLLQTVCVEADGHAINYAKELNERHAAQISFVHKNIFRFNTDEQFDMVWSAGLFDYFEDKVFIRLLQKFLGWTKPGGEVIIGNFGDHNPTRNYMELIGDWYLHHRSAEELTTMALEAGARREAITVRQEEEGVNLFLHVRA